jgi:RimJ/RimL family protein N-acetyltransferase
VIETERLILRPTAREDLDGWAELMDDPEASRFIGGPVARGAAWRG